MDSQGLAKNVCGRFKSNDRVWRPVKSARVVTDSWRTNAAPAAVNRPRNDEPPASSAMVGTEIAS
jgi:hypothetical protein